VSGSKLPADQPPRVVAEITHDQGYAGLVRAFRGRADELRIAVTGEAVHEVCGLPSFYFAKILSPSSSPRKRFGAVSLGPILAALGLKIILTEDRQALEQYTSRIPPRNNSFVHGGTVEFSISRRVLRKMQAKGGRSRWGKMTPKQRTALARKLNRIRWHGNGKANGL
jgi:hypothetical protein